MNHQKIQSVLYITLLLSSFTLMIGCQQAPQNRISTSGNRAYNLMPTHGWTIVQFPDPNYNEGNPIEVVVYNFIGLGMMEIGTIQKMEMRFEGQTLLFNIWDDQAIATNQPIEARLDLNFQQGFTSVTMEREVTYEVTYSDSSGTIYLVQEQHEVSPGIYRFRIEFENFGTSVSTYENQGLLGYVNLPLCEADRSCSTLTY